MKLIQDQTFDEERALYASRDIVVKSCRFDGPADGESAFKESVGVQAQGCYFNLRYPFWHDRGVLIRDSEMTAQCRAALWYSEDVAVTGTKLHGIKALRECARVTMRGCDVVSPEFGWSVRGAAVEHCTVEGEYLMMRASQLRFSQVQVKGKYSFQYVRDAEFAHCAFDTKDAFWHAENITVRNSVIKGEYLGWYSDGLTLIDCKVIGTQPLCYCKNLKLIHCEMIDTDLAFERSQVEATITTPVLSIKNPASGRIQAPAVGAVIRDEETAQGEVVIGGPCGEPCFCA